MLISKDGKYPVLRSLARAKRVSVETMAGWAGVSTPSINAKLQGRSGWKLDEAILIKQGLQSEEPLEVLFKKEL